VNTDPLTLSTVTPNTSVADGLDLALTLTGQRIKPGARVFFGPPSASGCGSEIEAGSVSSTVVHAVVPGIRADYSGVHGTDLTLRGGASCVLAETIGSLGAALHAGLGRVVVGIEISAAHHRGAREGDVTAVATLAHGGRTLATYEIVITDMAGHRVCTSRLTCLIRDQVPGRKANGIDPVREQGVIGS